MSIAPPPWSPGRLSLELAQAAGSRGVIAGQVADIAAENQPPDAAILDEIHRHKTGDLIRAAVRMGGIAAGAAPDQLSALNDYGSFIGLAFQITDDILDATGDSAQLGKTAGSDARHGKMTWVSVYGLEHARRTAAQLTGAAINALAGLPGNSEPLAKLARMMTERKK